ncbi:hypothetical protein B4073_0701 [Bacillus subtilis]|nr:hypothetical protein B4069_0742 [Bacillus subtilis]KIN33908.1 hypothetical protein B4070_0708 [Bacillus subtilis]KIN35546.1 hypothetical protein B4068_0695 [Bacillus subtilis]KIN42756.1 hypothetical protein B4071_0735 [Bacillus subtilis]KIN47253.1 hypothetical protein B4072_0727 [Bacillus subtilis]
MPSLKALFWLYNQLEKIDSIWSPRLAFSHIITVDFETGLKSDKLSGKCLDRL